ncbi:MAG: amidohydrolase family protein [Alphaproteobacteria bacterium]|nr:amidohydrolase family protein [Alphaproteobacteria bacterium]
MKQLIEGGRVLSPGRLGGGFANLLIDGDHIVAVLRPDETVTEDARRVDASDRLLIPGLVNAHTHAASNLSKGLADRWSLELLLNGFPWTAGGRTLDLKYLSARIGAVEMVRKGCTACYDLVAEIPAPSLDGIEAVARAYRDVGMRAVIAPMMADVSFWHAIPGLVEAMPQAVRERVEAICLQPHEASLATCRTLLKTWPFDRDRLRPALAPTIPHHCTDAFLTSCRALAAEHGAGLHMHVAESKVQAVVGIDRYGTTLVGHLARLGMLTPAFTAAHAIWLDDDDIRRLADGGAAVAHNPGSNLKLGGGLAATRRMRDLGVPVGVGTDGCSCSDNLNMFEAMRLAAFGSRIQGPDPRHWLTAAEAFEAATSGGARALGLRDRIGRLAPGYQADVVFLDLTSINYVPLNEPLNHVVFCEDGTGVAEVMIGGTMVVQGGKVVGVDMRSLATEAAAATARLAEVNAGARALVEILEPVVLDYCVGLARTPYHVERWCIDPRHPRPGPPAGR